MHIRTYVCDKDIYKFIKWKREALIHYEWNAYVLKHRFINNLYAWHILWVFHRYKHSYVNHNKDPCSKNVCKKVVDTPDRVLVRSMWQVPCVWCLIQFYWHHHTDWLQMASSYFFSARSARELISHQKQQGGAECSSPQRRDTQQQARGVRNSVAL